VSADVRRIRWSRPFGGAAAYGSAQEVQESREREGGVWKTLLLAEKTFRRLDASELLADVASGVVYVNGGRAVNGRGQKAAA
jgi:hypothetical protein